MRILIVDDDKDIRKIMKVYLQGEGFEVIEGENGEEALELIQPDIDMVILDIMMPKMDGITACSKIREKYFMPILFLTAKVEDMDKIAGLTVGADDYITKPFNPMEMVARVKSNLRRYITYKSLESDSKKDDETVELLDIKIDIRGHRVKKSGVEVALTKTEFGILELLATNRGQIFSLERIYERVWGEASLLNSENTVSVHIKKLREKIEDDIKKPKIIKTVWGVGYRVD